MSVSVGFVEFAHVSEQQHMPYAVQQMASLLVCFEAAVAESTCVGRVGYSVDVFPQLAVRFKGAFHL